MRQEQAKFVIGACKDKSLLPQYLDLTQEPLIFQLECKSRVPDNTTGVFEDFWTNFKISYLSGAFILVDY